ncbi:MAG TPA: glycoside hydrolase family 2 TIM barrel-domain containing protein [Verrucomicrobiae bacterium]|nr:glycoside hydrolase family 2 TIM barrel-domain containing protein [Verrucomicrobiae bacterium]
MNFPRTIGRLALLLAVCFMNSLTAATGPGTQIKYLSGTGKDDGVLWDFYCTAGMQSGERKKIAVPSCWELQGFGVYNYGVAFRGRNAREDVSQRAGFASEQGKYKTEFRVPSDWRGKTVRIVFEGVMVRTEVFVNGQPAGPAHEGSFYEFKYDITRLLKFGETNLLEVTVSKVAQDSSVMRAERQGDYWNFGGIFRPVYLEALPSHYIDWTGIDAEANGDFKADVHFGPGVKLGTAEVTARILDAQNQPVGAPFSARMGDGPPDSNLERIRLDSHFDGVNLWTAETPNLYRVQFTLLENGVPEHTITNQFGFRTIELRTNDGFYLNGKKILMKGVNRHSLWADSGRTLSPALDYEDARLIKDMNMNAVRMSHYPPDREFLDACDELGIYVLDELAGWQGAYDTPIGRKLIGEMVRRDVNHPSILVWDNGNEGGWNNALDGEFARWDIQQRIVMHPRSTDRGVNDPHYPDYAAVVRDSRGPAVYFPTEFLHGLYDGGLGGGFHDYWNVMSKSPFLGGAFFWVFCDDGVVRTDKGGIIDNSGNAGPDGIMGPRREKEGSYYTIKEIWSPVQIEAPAEGLRPGFQGAVKVFNSYDFTDLNQCKLSWAYVSFPDPTDGRAGHTVLAGGEIAAPSVAPHTSGELNLNLPAMQGVEAVYFTAESPGGRNLWTWSWPVGTMPNPASKSATESITTRDGDGQLTVNAGALELRFDKTSGFLAQVSSGGKIIPIGNGPRFIAYTHNSTGRGTVTYLNVAGTNTLTGLTSHLDGNDLLVEAGYDGAFRQAIWRISPDGRVKLDYTYDYDGPVDLLGVNFDFPETDMKGITWLGYGPYRVWQNRQQGTRLDVWQNAYNNTVPSVVYSFDPEFKGYFRDWRWATFDTSEGKFTVRTAAPESYLGIYTPNDGPVGPLLALPQTGLAFLDVIPAMRTKFLTQERMGPQSAEKHVSGERHGEMIFDFAGK